MPDRDHLVRSFAVHALTRPGNVLPAVAVAGAGLALGLWPLYIAAGAVYAGLAATTLFNRNEARKLLERERAAERASTSRAELPEVGDPGIRDLYERVRAEEERITEAVERATIPLPEVRAELTGLMDDVASQCGRAQAIVDYLGTVDVPGLEVAHGRAVADAEASGPELRPTLAQTASALAEQLETARAMAAELNRFEAEMRQVESSLGAIRAQVARLEIEAQPDASSRLESQVASARSFVRAIATPPAPGTRAGGSHH